MKELQTDFLNIKMPHLTILSCEQIQVQIESLVIGILPEYATANF